MDADRWPTTGWYGTTWRDWIRLSACLPDHFVAISAPVTERPLDIQVSARFRNWRAARWRLRFDYIRDQSPAILDGTQQEGNFLIFEADDRSEFGIWRRLQDTWQDLVPLPEQRFVRTASCGTQQRACALKVEAAAGRSAAAPRPGHRKLAVLRPGRWLPAG